MRLREVLGGRVAPESRVLAGFADPTFPASLPPGKERGRREDCESGDVHVQPHARELVGRVDAKRLDPQPPDAVQEHVEGEQVAWPKAHEPLHEQEGAGSGEAPESLVEERRVERVAFDVVDRPVVRIDLEPPRKIRGTAEELLVPPVTEATDSLRDEERRGDAVGEPGTASPERLAMTAPTPTPSPIPPQTPRPPFQIANGPHHSSGNSSQLVMTWYSRAPMIPNATPQTANRKMRSQSPPRRVHRIPVMTTAATIATSSVSP
jgi:hypothetical protein